MRIALFLLLTALVASAAPAAKPAAVHGTVLHLAPDFTFPGAGRNQSLRSLRGQPVVLLIADSAKTKEFRKQVKLLPRAYSRFASRQVVFAVAFREGPGPIATNVPVALVNGGGAVASAYGVTGRFGIAIIGRDGNIDYLTDHVVPPERINDVIQNAYPVQEEARREIAR